MLERRVLLSFVHGSCTMKSLLWAEEGFTGGKTVEQGADGDRIGVESDHGSPCL